MARRKAIPTQIETERLIIRPYEQADTGWFPDMVERNRTHLERYESENFVLSVRNTSQAADLIRDLAMEWRNGTMYTWGAFERESGEFAAQIVALSWGMHEGEYSIGYFADRAHEGRGYVTEAVKALIPVLCECLRPKALLLDCDDSNLRSRRVAERCGFTLAEHALEQHHFADGTVTGTLYFRRACGG